MIKKEIIQPFIPYIFILVCLITRELTENKIVSLDEFWLWLWKASKKIFHLKTLTRTITDLQMPCEQDLTLS